MTKQELLDILKRVSDDVEIEVIYQDDDTLDVSIPITP